MISKRLLHFLIEAVKIIFFLLDCIQTDCRNSCQKESKKLPKPRQVSLVIAQDKNKYDEKLSILAVLFGQFLDHDMSLSPEAELEHNCCEENDSECMKIELPSNDPFYSRSNQTCIHLTRSVPHCSSGFPPSRNREQQNVITSFLDASNIYGSDFERSTRVRTKVRGKLKVTKENNLLPEEELQLCKAPISGDARAMENPSLASLHTLFMREHNRICDDLWSLVKWTRYGNEDCDNDLCDEWIFQNARRILIAEWQNIIYSEWLPLILGNKRMKEFKLDLSETRRYNSSIDPSIISSFSTAAFRFGHSMIDGMLTKKNPKTQNDIKDISLSNTFFNRDEYEGKGVETLLAGLGEKKAQARDRFVTNQLTNFLFKQSPTYGQDLIARNIARGRDHGIPSFAKFYSNVGPKSDANRKLKCWGNIPQTFDNSTWEILKKVYIHPKDIDLFVGGLVEKNTAGGGVLGYTFGWIVAEQF
jgi:peroxidase